MDENNSNNAPPSQRDKKARSRIKTGVKIAAAVTNPVAFGLYAAGKAASDKAKRPKPAPTPTPGATAVTPPPTSFPSSSQTKIMGKKTAKAAGKVFLYSNPGIFLSGKIGSRIKQRFFAKKQIEEIEQAGEESRTAASTTKTNEPSPTQKLTPKKPSRFSAFRKTKLWKIGTAPIKYGTVAGLFYVGAKRLKASRQKGTPQPTDEKVPSEDIVEETGKTTNPATTPTVKKWIDYQKIWNNSRIKKALDRGYNRFTLLQKIRNSKALRTTWKYGKYAALGPVMAGSMDAYKFHKKRAAMKRETNANPGESRDGASQEQPASSTGLWSGYGNSGTPSPGIGKRAYNKFVSPRMSSLNNRLGRKLGNKAISRGVASAGRGVATQAAKQLTQQAAMAFLKTPPGWITIGVIIAIILFIALIITVVISISGGGGSSDSPGAIPGIGAPPKNANPIPGLTLNKAVSATNLLDVAEITYTITYNFSPSSQVKKEDITIYDTVPNSTTLVANKTTGNFNLDTSGKVISWPLSDPVNQNLNTFSFTVTPQYSGTLLSISNSAYATANGSSSNPIGTSATNCGGFYSFSQAINGQTFTNPRGNFADTDCLYANSFPQVKDDLYDLLKAQDPVNADRWFLRIIPCESSYIPNAYRDHNQIPQTPDPNGAWGLFQIGSSQGSFDNGAVAWQEQVVNAVNLLKTRGWGYWGC